MTENNEVINLINQARAQARADRFRNFFGKNSKRISTVVLVVTVVLITYFIFNLIQSSRQEKYSEMLHESLINQQIGNLEKAKENLKSIYETKSAPSGVRALASIRYAAFLLEEGKKTEAASIYEEIHDCLTCDDYIRDLAGLLAVRVWIGDEAEMAKEDLSKRIEKIENSSSVLKYYVAEQRAFYEMHKNNLEKSYKIFDLIAKNPEVSQVLKGRANDGLKMVVARGYEPKSEVSMKTEEKAPEAKTEKN